MIGRWRITQADLWDQNYLDLCGPTTLLIAADGHGEIGFGALQAGLILEGYLQNLVGSNPKMQGTGVRQALLAYLSEAAMSAIDRNSTSVLSWDGRNPRRRQNTAASSSTAFTTKTRPPISAAPLTLGRARG